MGDDLITYELQKSDLLGLGANIYRLNKAVLELLILANKGDHGHQTFA